MAGSARAIEAGRAYFQLFADNSELLAGLRGAEAAVSKFIANIQVIGARIGNLGSQMFLPLKDLISEYARFDDQMRITAAVTNSTERVYHKLSQTAMQATKAMTFKPVEVGGAMAQLGKAGFSSREIEDSTLAVMELSRATGVTLPEATKIASTIMRTFNMNSKQMGDVVDVMTASANTAMQSVTDLADALSYAGPIAAQVGMDIKETSKAVSVLANFGIRGSRAGTALRQMLSRMGNTRVQGLYKELGVELTDATGKMRGLGSVLVDVGKALSKLPDMKRLSYLTKMFGMYGMAGGAVLTAHGFDSVADAIDHCDGVAQRTAERMDAGIGGFLRRLSTTLSRLAVTVGRVAAPAFMRWNTAVGLAGEILERIIAQNGKVIRGILNLGGALIGVSAGFIGSAVVLKGFSAILASIRIGITPAVRAVGLFGKGIGGIAGFAGKGVRALKSVYASIRAFNASKMSLKGLNFGNVGAGMLGVGAALHVLNGNAKQVREWLKEIGDRYPKLAKLSSVLMSLMDKFGIGSNAIRKFAAALAAVGAGLLIVPRIVSMGEGIGRLAKRILELAGAAQHSLFGSLTRIGVTSLVAGTGFRLLDGNIGRVRDSLVSFAKQVPAASGACNALVKVVDKLSASSGTFSKKADFFNKLSGFALAVQPLRAAAGAVRSVGSSMAGAILAVTRPVGRFVQAVRHLSRSLNRLLDRSLLGFLALFGASFVGLAATWKVARGSIDSLAASILKLKDTFPELAGVIDMASEAVLRFGRIADTVLGPIVSLGKGIGQVSSQVLGAVTAFAATVGYLRLTSRMFSRFLPWISDVAAMVAETVVTAISVVFPPLAAVAPMVGQIVRHLTAAAGVTLYLGSVIQVFGKTFEAVSGKVYKVLSGNWLVSIINKIIGMVGRVAGYVGDAFNSIASVVQNAVGQLGGGLFGELFKAMDGLLEKIGDLVRAFLGISDSGKGFLADFGAAFQGFLQKVFAGAQNTVQNIVSFVKDAVAEMQGIVQLAFAGFRAGQVEKTIAYLFTEVKLKAAQIYVFVRESIVKVAQALAEVGQSFVSRIPDITQAFVDVANQIIKIAEVLTKMVLGCLETIRYKIVTMFIDVKRIGIETSIRVMSAVLGQWERMLAQFYRTIEKSFMLRQVFGISRDEAGLQAIHHEEKAYKYDNVGKWAAETARKRTADDRKSAEETHGSHIAKISELQFNPLTYSSEQVQTKLQKMIDLLTKEIEVLEKNWSEQNAALLEDKLQQRDAAKAELQERIEAHEGNQDYRNDIKDRREAAEKKQSDANEQRARLAQQKTETKERLAQDKAEQKQYRHEKQEAKTRYEDYKQSYTEQYGPDQSQWPQSARDTLESARNDYQEAIQREKNVNAAVRADQSELRGLNEQDYVQQTRQQSAKSELKQIAKEERIKDKVYRDNPDIEESQSNISKLDQELQDYVEGGGSSRSAYANKLRGRRRREQRKLDRMERRRDRLERKYGLKDEQFAEGDFAAQAEAASNPIVNIKMQSSSVGTFDPHALGGFDNAYWYREETKKQTDILTDIRDYAQSIDTALNEEASVAWL